ncbi:MAG: glycosyltransferase family 9 protein [Ekhidna sp.]
MKILIINSVSSQESLLVSPLLRVLKTELGAETHLVIHEKNRNPFQLNPYLDKVYLSTQSPFQLRKDLKKEHFDYTVDLRNSSYSVILRLGVSKKTLVFNNRRFKRWLYSKTKLNLLPTKHKVDQYVDLLKPLGIKGDNLGIDFFLPEKDFVENDWLPDSHQNGYVAIAIEGSYYTKKLPVNRLIELCDRINKPIILIGDSQDVAVADEVELFFQPGSKEEEQEIEKLNKKTVIFSACGKFNFNQSASIIKQANWVFTYDNQMMHVAAAFKKRIYTIWGSSSPLFGTYPYRTQFTVFENNKLSCRPCSIDGYENCPKGHFQCMNDLNFDFYLPD